MADKLNDYKALTLRCDTASDYMPQLPAVTGDRNGRVIRAVLTNGGKDVDPDGITARLLYDPEPDNPKVFGDRIPMTPVADAATATFEAPIPSSAIQTTGRKTLGIQFVQDDGKPSQSAVVTRPFTLVVESGVLKVESSEAVGEFEEAVRRAEAARDQAEVSAANADASEKLAAKHLADIGTSKQDAAASATAAANSATAAASSASAAKTSQDAAKASETATAASATAAASSENHAKTSETNAANSAAASAAGAKAAQGAVDNFGIDVTSTTTGDPGTNADVTSRKTGTRYELDFTVPRGDNGWSLRTYEGAVTGTTADRTKIHPDTDIAVGDGLLAQNQTDTGDLVIGLYTITALTDRDATVSQLVSYTLEKGVKGDTGTIENLTIDAPLKGNGATQPIGLDVSALRGDGIGGTNGKLAVKPKTDSGIEVTADGVAAVVDGTTVTLQDGRLHAPGGAKILHATFAINDFNADLVAVKAIPGLDDVAFVAPSTTSIDNVDAYNTAAPVIQDHADDPAIPAGSLRMTCTNEPTADITLSIATFKERQ